MFVIAATSCAKAIAYLFLYEPYMPYMVQNKNTPYRFKIKILAQVSPSIKYNSSTSILVRYITRKCLLCF